MLSTLKTIASITCNDTPMIDTCGSVFQTRKQRLTQNADDLPKVTWLVSMQAELRARLADFTG